MFKVKKRFNGVGRADYHAYPIATSTAISEGDVVVISEGLVVQASTANQTSAILGIAAETHGGSADPFNERANGAEIFVYDNPDTEFIIKPVSVETATDGTNLIAPTIATMIKAFTSDVLNGGVAKLTAKAADSTLAVGAIKAITDGAAGTTYQELVISGSTKDGETWELYPPIGQLYGGFNSTFDGIAYSGYSVALPFVVLGYDTDKAEIYVKPSVAISGAKLS